MPPLPDAFRPVIARDPHGSHMLGEIYAAAGERDEALAWLGNAVRLGVVNVRYLTEQSPFFASLRGDPAFEALVAEARARAARERS